MSLSRLFSKSESKNSSLESTARKMNRGREVLRGKLWMRKHKTSKKQLAEVIVYSATHDGKQAGQLEIFEEVNKTYQKPKKVVLLTEIAQPGVQGGSPCPSLSSSPSAQSPRNSFIATSPSSHSPVVWPFQVISKIGEVYEFFVETPEDQKQWLKRLSLLIMFPYSPIPEEPAVNPIKESFKLKLKPKDYNADSVWAVYILPEEVGSRVNVLGTHILTLKSRVSESQPGQLSIISLVDSTPIVTWDRDKMRRTGCLGNMVFVEIGRRCRGGPGLVWMYVGPKETAALRETLHMFLFKGDGRAVPISAQQHPPDPTRASFDSGFSSSYLKRGSQSSLQRSPSINTPQRQLSIDSQHGSDSGHHSSPLSSHHHRPPPIDFDSHPNRQKRSAPRNISTHHSQYENTDIDSGVASRRSSSSYRDSVSSESYLNDDQFTLDPESSLTDSLQDDKFPAGILEEPDGHSYFSSRHHQEGPHTHPPSRHYSIPNIPSRPLHRSHSTSTCHPSQRSEDYERMIHPRQQISQEGYIVMQPAQITGPESAMAQLQLAQSPTTNTSTRISPPHNSSLHPINEDKSSDYENYPLDRDIDSEQFTYYTPSYENIENVRQELSYRRQSSDEVPPPIIYRSHSSSNKETVTLSRNPQSCSPPSSQHQNVRVVEHCTSLTNCRNDSPSPVLIPTP